MPFIYAGVNYSQRPDFYSGAGSKRYEHFYKQDAALQLKESVSWSGHCEEERKKSVSWSGHCGEEHKKFDSRSSHCEEERRSNPFVYIQFTILIHLLPSPVSRLNFIFNSCFTLLSIKKYFLLLHPLSP